MIGKYRAAVVLAAILALPGCRQDMHDQPRYEAFEVSDFFENGMASRQLPAGTVARGLLLEDDHYYQGKDESGELVATLPASIELDRELLERGRDRYEIFCSPCHDSTGSGRGMIVRRGFKQPQPLYEQRLRDMPIGYFFDVVTQGYGVMSSYSRMVPVEDRWAIAAYIRVLQASQTQNLNDMSPEMRAEFETALSQQIEPLPEEDAHHE